jgi:hypothetical protein
LHVADEQDAVAVLERELTSIVGGASVRLESDEGTKGQQGAEAGHDLIGRRIHG